MAAITASMVAELRAKTDAPMMECKKALTEAEGDMAKAEELLRVKLGTKAGKAASRVTAEGVVASFIDGNTGAMIEVNCETDFVTKNDSFLAMAKAAAELVAKHNPADIAALGALAYEQDGFGPPGRRAQGPDRQDRREHVLPPLPALGQRRRPGHLPARHPHRRGRRVRRRRRGRQGRGDAHRRHEARGPDLRRRAGRPDRPERSVAEAKAAESGKPAEIVAKMVEGSVQKYLKEVSLLDQVFVKAADGKQTVAPT
jgi:elongation factor Ts